MHRHFLKGYSEKQTRFDRLLDTGRYNCVSSAVLYAILGTAVGIDVTGVRTVDHAFCSVRVDGEDIDVETTNLYGFNPGTKTEFHEAFGKTTGFVYVSPGNYRNRTTVGLVELFSLTILNRISEAESAGRFSEAVGMAADRWALLGGGSGAAYEDLIERMINYGASLAKAGKEEEALAWADSAIAAYGRHYKWDDFVSSAANNIIVKLIRQRKTAEARIRFDELRPRMIDETALELERAVSDAELMAAYNEVESGGDESGFIAALDNARQAGVLPEERIRNVEEIWLLNRLNNIARTDGWQQAIKAVDLVAAEYGSRPVLEDAKRIYRQNRFAELYNKAVSAYNSRRFTEAGDITRAALEEFPGDSRLASLMAAIEKALAAGGEANN